MIKFYILILIITGIGNRGPAMVEVHSKSPGFTLSQCEALGEGWKQTGAGNKFKCLEIPK